MRITWLSKLLLLGLALSITALADDSSFSDKVKNWFSAKPKSAVSTPTEKPKGKCINVMMFGWEILQRLDAGVYEVQTVDPTPFCDVMYGVRSNCRMMPGKTALLFTLDDKFASAGRIGSPLWIDYQTDKKLETMEVTLNNGFKKQTEVIRESAACTAYGQEQQMKEAQKEKAEQEKSRKIAAEQTAKEKRQKKKQKLEEAKEHQEKAKAEELWK